MAGRRSPATTPSACNPTPAARASSPASSPSAPTTAPTATDERTRLPHPVERPRHERRQRGDGRDGRGRRRHRRRRQRRPRRPARQARRWPATELAAIMVTYPSTHGVFEEAIGEICDDRARCRRPGVRRRRQPQRPRRSSPARATSAPTSATSTCTRRSASPTAAAAPASARSPCAPICAPFLPGHPLGGHDQPRRSRVGGAVRVGRDPADPVGVHRADGSGRA